MSGESILIIIVMSVVTGAALLLPFIRHNETIAEIEARKKRDSLLMAYERVLLALRDLEEDLTTGKIPSEDYDSKRQQWAERGVALLQQLEAVGIKPPKAKSMVSKAANAHAKPEAALDAAIEAAIAQYVNAQTAEERR